MVRAQVITKKVRLQEWEQKYGGTKYRQFRITVPTEIVEQCELSKGDYLDVVYVPDEPKSFQVSAGRGAADD